MNLDYGNSKDAYVRLLSDTLKKKIEILTVLYNLTEQQGKLISADVFNEELFEVLISNKSVQLELMEQIDVGFAHIYENVNEEFRNNKDMYKKEIIELQNYIQKITEISVNIQVLEKRNKTKLDFVFSNKREQIKLSRISRQTASSYYKNMSNSHDIKSIFYDEKK